MPAIVIDNDDLGMINWSGYDGSDYSVSAQIYAEVDGTPVPGDVPTRIDFCNETKRRPYNKE